MDLFGFKRRKKEKKIIEKNVNFTKNLLNILTPKIKNFILVPIMSKIYLSSCKILIKR